MDITEIRKLFPITAQKVYLNHAAISPLSSRVTEKLEWYIDERMFGVVDTHESAVGIRHDLRKSVARLINTQPENIGFVTNTSEGFNWLVHGLKWQKGDQVILFDYEFPSNIYPFLQLEKQGVEMVWVKNRDGAIDIDDIEAAITSKTRLLSISFVEYVNGYRNNLKAIGALCKAHQIIFSVDGIQGNGALHMDVSEFQIDFMSNGAAKWLMGTMGVAFVYIRPQLLQRLEPAFAGWLGVENAWDFSSHKLDYLPDARRLEIATANFMGITALYESLALLLETGLPQIEAHLLRLGDQLINGMRRNGLQFMGSENPARRSGISSFSGKDIPGLADFLMARNIICSVRNGWLRVSPHFYNSEEEIQRIIDETALFYNS